MRIVDVCAFYTPHGGGVRTYIDQKLALADSLGQDVTVLVPGDRDETIERSPAARIVALRAPKMPVDRRYGYFDDEAAIHAVLDSIAPDFVEVSSPWRSPVMVANWRPDVPKSMVMHADPLSAYFYRWFGPFMPREMIDSGVDSYWRHLRRLSRQYDRVVCANRELADRLKDGGVANTHLLPMGVAEGVYSPSRRSASVRAAMLAECGLGEDATLLISVGRIAPEKRLPMLAEAVTMAGRQRAVGLIVLGEGRDTPALLRAIAGNPHIRVLKPERERARFATIMASADALLHGCEAETFCMAAAEARASGIPVIVPNGGGAAEFAADGGGLAYRSADRADAVRAILELPDTAPEGYGPREVRTMRDHFTELFALYQDVADRRRSAAA